MCLAIPGKIISISDDKSLMRMGKIDFAGIVKEVSLVYVPQAKVGDYVIVHAGFAIQILNQREAQESLDAWRELEEVS
jgi:hydrogenase expression/formation protein HypC